MTAREPLWTTGNDGTFEPIAISNSPARAKNPVRASI
jgi:hypothetical protein